MTRKPNYGIDAPYVIGNLLLACVACVVLSLVVRDVTVAHIRFEFSPDFLYAAVWFGLPAVLMLIYSKVGKFRHRDRILAKVQWTGKETVLDVGTGRGLLVIGAAKRLTTGYAVGIDIWNVEDLSGNNPEGLLDNISLEGVSVKTIVKSEDVRLMSFADASFDVLLSNLCLHNIYEQAGRFKACHEIARVLKLGGVVVISDYKHLGEYESEFINCGLLVERCPLDWIGTFPPLRILVARKPGMIASQDTVDYIALRAERADVVEALALLRRPRVGEPPREGDELPESWKQRQAALAQEPQAKASTRSK